MLSALIPSAHSYPAMPLAEQLVHQRCVHPGPLVLSLKEILSALPTLTASELEVVIATASALRATSRSGKQPARQPKAVKAKKTGPESKTSVFANNEDYKSFKSAEKALKLYLKDNKLKLSEAEKAIPVQPIVANFLEVRSRWFRTKATLERNKDEKEPSAPPPDEEKKEKAA